MFSVFRTRIDDFGRLHVDTKGKVDTSSVNGDVHFLTITDEFSRFTMTYQMEKKTQASEFLLKFIIRIVNNQVIQSKQ